ncbi:MAG: hypothetical protein AAGK09_08700 [Planctomycetota bacterium]
MSALWLILAAALPLATGWLVADGLGARTAGSRRAVANATLVAVLALPIGMLLHGGWFAVAAVALPGMRWLPLVGDAALLAGAWCAWRRLRLPSGRRVAGVRRPGLRDAWPLIAMAVVAALSIAAAWGWHRVAPLGEWDALAMWTLRARMLDLAPPTIGVIFAAPFAHPDYPLMLSANVARLWRWSGQDGLWVSGAVSAVSAGLMPAIVGAVCWRQRGAWLGLAGLLGAAGCYAFVRDASTQYADTWLATTMAGAAAAMAVTIESRRGSAWRWGAIAGLLLGAAAFTKNEGVLFAALMLAAAGLTAWLRRDARWAIGLVVGLLPGALLVAWIKWMSVDPAAGVGHAGPGLWAERLLDGARWAEIGRGLRSMAGANLEWATPALLVAGAVVLRCTARGRRGWLAPLALGGVAVSQAAVYLAFYVLGSPDPAWHVHRSADRLSLHLWPTVVMAAVLLCPRLSRPAR